MADVGNAKAPAEIDDFDVAVFNLQLNDETGELGSRLTMAIGDSLANYPIDSYTRVFPNHEFNSEKVVTEHSLGLPWPAKSCFGFLEANVLAYISGNHVEFVNLTTKERVYLHGLRCGGLSAFAVHPSRNYVCLAETHKNGPNILIFSYPTMSLHRVLRGGAVASYSRLAFATSSVGSDGVSLLLSVSGAPDYNLCVWDWNKEHLLLRSRAFATDILAASFSPFSSMSLITSGPAHIKFWSIADTFTGLKLQGALGRFGVHELADIPAFVVLPILGGSQKNCLNDDLQPGLEETNPVTNTRVLSATDSGPLLLWDDGLILLSIPMESPVTSMFVIPFTTSQVVLGCKDGSIRVYDVSALMAFEVPANSKKSLISPILQPLVLTKDCAVVEVIPFPRVDRNTNELPDVLAIDAKGSVWKCDLKAAVSAVLFERHAGPVSDLAMGIKSHILYSVGALDASLRLHNVFNARFLSSRNLPANATCVLCMPEQIDPICSSFVVGFSDGSLRFFQHTSVAPSPSTNYKTCLTHAFKPFKTPIKSMRFSNKATYLIVMSSLGDFFFFLFPCAISRMINGLEVVEYKEEPFCEQVSVLPLGTVPQKHKIFSFSLFPLRTTTTLDKGMLTDKYVASTNTGELQIMIVRIPKDSHDVKNYMLSENCVTFEPWHVESYPFFSSKIEILSLAATRSKSQDAAKTDSNAVLNSADSGALSNEKSDSSNETKSQHEKPSYIIKLPVFISETLMIAYIERSDNVFEVRAFLFPENKTSVLILETTSPVTSLHADHIALVVGCQNGVVYFCPFTPERFDNWPANHETHKNRSPLPYFKRALHLGSVVSVGMSFDSTYICSAGEDGSIILSLNKLRKISEPHYSTNLAILAEGHELVSNYTIQEFEQMTKNDQDEKLALSKKNETLEKFRRLKTEFEALYNKNARLSQSTQLGEEELQIDDGLEELFEKQTKERVLQVRKEMAWDLEKVNVLLRKAQDRFTKSVAEEVVFIKCFRSNTSLCTFRTPRIPEIQFASRKQDEQRVFTYSSAQIYDHDKIRDINAGVTKKTQENFDNHTTKSHKKINDAASRLEVRLKEREKREEQLKQLLATRPNVNSEDPKDVEAIKSAEKNVGDYKLKTDKNYVVREDELVNAEIKMKQLIYLQSSLANMMALINKPIRRLVQERVEIKNKIAERNQNAKTIIATLESLGKSYYYDEEKFTFRAIDKNKNSAIESSNSELNQDVISNFESEENETIVQELCYRLKQISFKNCRDVNNFDKSVNKALRDKIEVSIDVKQGELKLLLYYREWKLLKEFEKHDHLLMEKFKARHQEKNDIDAKVYEIQNRMDEKHNEVRDVMQQKRALEQSVKEIVSDSKNEEILLKIYKKKIKRKRKKETRSSNGPNASDDDDTSESSDFSSNDENGSDDGDDENVDGCPASCDPAVYSRVLQSREEKTEIDERLAELQKFVDSFEKEFEILSKKEKSIAMALKQIENEIRDFQCQKQQKLNELYTVVPVTTSQIHVSEENYKDALIFSEERKTKLSNRIEEIKIETDQVRVEHKALKLAHVNLLASRKEKRQELKEAESKCLEVQLLKFGKIIDFEKLEKIGTCKNIDELNKLMLEKERQWNKKLGEKNNAIEALKLQYRTVIIENTRILEAIHGENQTKKSIELRLEKNQKNLLAHFGARSEAEQLHTEREKIKAHVAAQEERINQLKLEISGLVRKSRVQKAGP